ncbi:hypothetical protein GGQ86_001966 [Xanthobacter flavus]|uniref:Uncharacterized protein n=1 Tax=Xanthobacter flavus TaxID=281 RepID=A0A9W6CKA3_XANFL|nr:hypothetical protein [Xanthobacter flavus]MDR6333496.1 hypothetical protein [Xanthobacter flavus]GLI20752.1 hypothetical protein XFLAVUS301_04260 [Xanthobacter flavus]
MAHPRKTERRLLTDSEMELVEKSRQSVVTALGDGEVNDLVAQLRERRDRALTIANNQRRALRGKGGRGEVTFEKADSGNRQKASVLTDALTRARREQTRRRIQEARAELVENAHKALELKRDSKRAKRPANLPRPNAGMTVKERTRLQRIGSASGEAGRVTKFVAVAQAKKDSRG